MKQNNRPERGASELSSSSKTGKMALALGAGLAMTNGEVRKEVLDTLVTPAHAGAGDYVYNTDDVETEYGVDLTNSTGAGGDESRLWGLAGDLSDPTSPIAVSVDTDGDGSSDTVQLSLDGTGTWTNVTSDFSGSASADIEVNSYSQTQDKLLALDLYGTGGYLSVGGYGNTGAKTSLNTYTGPSSVGAIDDTTGDVYGSRMVSSKVSPYEFFGSTYSPVSSLDLSSYEESAFVYDSAQKIGAFTDDNTNEVIIVDYSGSTPVAYPTGAIGSVGNPQPGSFDVWDYTDGKFHELRDPTYSDTSSGGGTDTGDTGATDTGTADTGGSTDTDTGTGATDTDTGVILAETGDTDTGTATDTSDTGSDTGATDSGADTGTDSDTGTSDTDTGTTDSGTDSGVDTAPTCSTKTGDQASPEVLCTTDGGTFKIEGGTISLDADKAAVLDGDGDKGLSESADGATTKVETKVTGADDDVTLIVSGKADIALAIESDFVAPPSAERNQPPLDLIVTAEAGSSVEMVHSDGSSETITPDMGAVSTTVRAASSTPDTGDTGAVVDTDTGETADTSETGTVDTQETDTGDLDTGDLDTGDLDTGNTIHSHRETGTNDPTGCACASTNPSGLSVVAGFGAAALAMLRRRKR